MKRQFPALGRGSRAVPRAPPPLACGPGAAGTKSSRRLSQGLRAGRRLRTIPSFKLNNGVVSFLDFLYSLSKIIYSLPTRESIAKKRPADFWAVLAG